MKKNIMATLAVIGVVILTLLFVADGVMQNNYEDTLDIRYLLIKEIIDIVINRQMIMGVVVFAVLLIIIRVITLKITIKSKGHFYIGTKALIVLLAITIVIVCNLMPQDYTIEGKKINRFEKISLLVQDCRDNTTTDIITTDFKIRENSYRSRKSNSSITIQEYYLDINNNLIPIPKHYATLIQRQEGRIEPMTFTVFKYSRMIVNADGDLLTKHNTEAEKEDIFFELVMGDDNIIYVNQIKDYKNYELIDSCVINFKCGETISNNSCKSQIKPVTYKDGTYSVYVTQGGTGGKLMSNTITYTVKNGMVE